jgi:hypothetical protein
LRQKSSSFLSSFRSSSSSDVLQWPQAKRDIQLFELSCLIPCFFPCTEFGLTANRSTVMRSLPSIGGTDSNGAHQNRMGKITTSNERDHCDWASHNYRWLVSAPLSTLVHFDNPTSDKCSQKRPIIASRISGC